jgi:uncharacterized RDD family membrane protein YckC
MTAELTRPAGLWRRLAAMTYDGLLVAAVLFVLTGAVIAARGGRTIGPGSLWYQALLLTACWLYFAWSWTHGGQTVGMRAWRLYVLAADDKAVDWRSASRRFVAAWFSALPLGLGFFWAWLDPAGLTWHDRLSRTRLVHRPRGKPTA